MEMYKSEEDLKLQQVALLERKQELKKQEEELKNKLDELRKAKALALEEERKIQEAKRNGHVKTEYSAIKFEPQRYGSYPAHWCVMLKHFQIDKESKRYDRIILGTEKNDVIEKIDLIINNLTELKNKWIEKGNQKIVGNEIINE